MPADDGPADDGPAGDGPAGEAEPRLSHPRHRVLRGATYRDAQVRRARLRAAAAAQVAAEGLAGFNLHRVAAAAGSKFDIARHHYPTNAMLLADVVRHHQAAVAERMTEALLALPRVPADERVAQLSICLLEALAAEAEGHRATMAALHAVPSIAHNARHGDRWLVDRLAAVIAAGEMAGEAAGETPPLLLHQVLARALLAVLEHWALTLTPQDGPSRAACATLAAAMVRGATTSAAA